MGPLSTFNEVRGRLQGDRRLQWVLRDHQGCLNQAQTDAGEAAGTALASKRLSGRLLEPGVAVWLRQWPWWYLKEVECAPGRSSELDLVSDKAGEPVPCGCSGRWVPASASVKPGGGTGHWCNIINV